MRIYGKLLLDEGIKLFDNQGKVKRAKNKRALKTGKPGGLGDCRKGKYEN